MSGTGEPVIVFGQYLGVIVLGGSIALIACICAVVSWRDEQARRRQLWRIERLTRAKTAAARKWAGTRKEGAA